MNNFRIGDFFQILDDAVYCLMPLTIALVSMALFGFAVYLIKEICCRVFNH